MLSAPKLSRTKTPWETRSEATRSIRSFDGSSEKRPHASNIIFATFTLLAPVPWSMTVSSGDSTNRPLPRSTRCSLGSRLGMRWEWTSRVSCMPEESGTIRWIGSESPLRSVRIRERTSRSTARALDLPAMIPGGIARPAGAGAVARATSISTSRTSGGTRWYCQADMPQMIASISGN